MDECVRSACPCLESLWRRVTRREKSSSSPGGEGAQEADPPAPGPAAPPAADCGSMYTAVWSFEARHRDELSFQAGDTFSVLSRRGDWWTARRIDSNGRVLDTGIVPNNYLVRAEEMRTQPWFFGTMNRFEAQVLLLGDGNQERSFLVRHSEKDNVGFVLSVRTHTRVKHFKIHQTVGGDFFVETNQLFSSLIHLVQHYSNNSLIGSGRLGRHCTRKKPSTTDLNHFTVDEWELPKDEFTLEEELGSGYFADVHRGLWKNQINVAIKILKSDSEVNQREFQREVQILKSLRHRHLISLFAVCTASPPYYIITELMEKGSLLHFLRGPEGHQQVSASLIDMGAQVADGMSYLEEQNSIHRDLAARNVLVGGDLICKVADFGLARIIKEPIYVTEDKKIPYKWSAPEAISHGKFSIKSDVWAFGVLLYEIITFGGVPYPGFSNQEVFEQVSAGYRMPAPAKCPDFLYRIMSQCWSAEPENRPRFKSLRNQLDSSSYELE